MGPNREDLLKNMKDFVIEVFFYPNSGRKPIRATLRMDLLPKVVSEDAQQLEQIDLYHHDNPKLIAYWDTNKKVWGAMDIDTVQYVQILDGY